MIYLFNSSPYIFHTQVKNHSKHKKEILDKILSVYDKNRLNKNYFWTTNSDSGVITNYHNMSSDILKTESINEILWDPINEFINTIYSDDSNPIRPTPEMPKSERFIIDALWWNVYNPGDYVEYHSHNRQGISGIYFLDLPNDAKNTTVFVNHNSHPMINYSSLILQTHTADYVKEGDVLLFPSTLHHYVNKVSCRKVSISFNVTIEV